MCRVVLFGGTNEGRNLCETCAEHAIPVLYCVATEDGARPANALPTVEAHVGRLNAAEMVALLKGCAPALVVDATHPYAAEASENIGAASQIAKIPLLRVVREDTEPQGCLLFTGVEDLLVWLEKTPGNIFVTTGSSFAKAFTKLPDYQRRIWTRVLPSVASLCTCLDLGYRPEQIICMQGPFSEALNLAMFQAANARILVTKDTGAPGGFSEKARAAQKLKMLTAVLSKPKAAEGVTLAEACRRILELKA